MLLNYNKFLATDLGINLSPKEHCEQLGFKVLRAEQNDEKMRDIYIEVEDDSKIELPFYIKVREHL